MKRIFLLLAAVLSFAWAQGAANKSVPVTVLGYDVRVVWPAPTLQEFGAACDEAATAAFSLAHKMDAKAPETVPEHACYKIMVAGADKQATTLNFIAGYTRQGAGYQLTFEKSDSDGRLIQVWQKKGAATLIYVFTFGDKEISLVVGRIASSTPDKGQAGG